MRPYRTIVRYAFACAERGKACSLSTRERFLLGEQARTLAVITLCLGCYSICIGFVITFSTLSRR